MSLLSQIKEVGKLELGEAIFCFLKLNFQVSVTWDFSDKGIYLLHMNERYIWDHCNIQDGALCDFSQQLKVVN